MPVEIFSGTPFMETCMEISVSGECYRMASSSVHSAVTSAADCQVDFLTCGICLSNYTSPKILPCLHTFCEPCLFDYIPAHSLGVTCPICRQQSILPEQGVSSLQDNHFIINLMAALGQASACGACAQPAVSTCTACHVLFCQQCHNNQLATDSTHSNGHSNDTQCSHEHTIQPLTDPTSANGEVTVDKMAALVCPNHNGLSLEYYCTNCETAICESCTTGEHSSHLSIPLADAILEHKQTLSVWLDKTQGQIPDITRAIGVVEEVARQLGDNFRQAELAATQAFAEVVRLFEQRREALLAEMAAAHARKHEALTAQAEQLRHTLQNMRSCCAFTEKALQCGNETEVLLVRKEMSEKLSQLCSQPLQKAPEDNAQLAFSDADFTTLRKHVASAGSLQCNSAVAYESTASGEALRRCTVNKCGTVNVITKDAKGDLVKVGHSSLTADVTTATSDDIIVPEIVDHKNGTYNVNYSVPDVGIYSLSIKLYGQPIKGSPFKIKSYKETDSPDSHSSRIPKTMAVKQRGTKRPSSSRSQGSNRKSNTVEDDLLLRVGEKGRNRGEFTNPQGVVVHEDKLIVADSNNQCIQVFTSIGEYRHKFGIRGRQSGQMQRPTGLAVTLNGNYLVADYDNKWVSVHSPEGKYLNRIGAGKLLGPKGVIVDHDGRIIVVDNKQSCVCIFQNNGKFLHKFGSRGNQEHQLAGPHFCAVTQGNDIVVSDFHNHCVKVFDSEGTFRFSFGSHGEGNGQFNAPTGVAVDRIGNILVADWGNSRIQVFDSQGSFLSFINTSAEPLYGPQGLTINSENHVVVADSGNHCIKIYRYLQ